MPPGSKCRGLDRARTKKVGSLGVLLAGVGITELKLALNGVFVWSNMQKG
jgi:hypothetical protein